MTPQTNTIDDGGPAFSRASTLHANGNAWTTSQEGMSLRDWFAGQMLAGEFVQNEYAGHYSNDCPQQTLVDRAKLLYRMADAMITARK